MDYFKHSLTLHRLIFKRPVDVLHHMFCVLGNGIDSKTFSKSIGDKKYYTLDSNYFNNLTPESLSSFIYPYSSESMYTPFMKYSDIKNSDNINGIKSAMEYFIKCLEMTTFDSMKKRYEIEAVEYSVEDVINSHLSKNGLSIDDLIDDELEIINDFNQTLTQKYKKQLPLKLKKYEDSKYEIEQTLNDWKRTIPLMKKQFNIE